MAPRPSARRGRCGAQLHNRSRCICRRWRTLGDNCKVQNYALVYEPAVLGDGVFIGPAAVLTNDEFPRAVNADGSPRMPPIGSRSG